MINKRHRQNGFTLVELLAAVAILIIFLAISLVAIVTYVDRLKITELDNAAREIYMAAQNRAVLLKNNERLEELVVADDGSNRITGVKAGGSSEATMTVYYVHSEDNAIRELIQAENIEPTLYDGDFYVVYEPASASVVDVFFSKETLLDDGTDFEDFYRKWRNASRNDRMRAKPMIGYYGGEPADSASSLTLNTPVITIHNEETLWVEVTYWVPQRLSSNASEVTLAVTVDYKGSKAELSSGELTATNKGAESTSYTYKWTLDSLESGNQFKDLNWTGSTPTSFGDDFTITADVSYTGSTASYQVNGSQNTASDNSLFATESDDTDTAYIEYERHLQNLRTAYSGAAASKIKAVQIADITCTSDRDFLPIENGSLTSYTGKKDDKNYEIHGLRVDTTAGSGAAGLFGTVSGMTLSDITLVNAAVSGNGPTGSLVGSGTNLKIEGCSVYWENSSGSKKNLRSLLGDSDDGINYKVTSLSGAAGGLAGSLTDSTIRQSFAATTVKAAGTTGTAAAGGLIGTASGTTSIETSYGDNYLQGKSAAGLIGNLAGSADIKNSYAAGFIDSTDSTASGTTTAIAGAKAAGIALGNGTASVTNGYSAMKFTSGADNYPLSANNGRLDHAYYLSGSFGDNSKGLTDYEKSYTELSDSTKIADLFGVGSAFAAKNAQTSYPYNLQTSLKLTAYEYPGLAALDHYGDWGATFKSGSLVYYEKYKDGSHSFSGGNLSMTFQSDAVEDGYAIAVKAGDDMSGVTITYTYLTANGTKEAKEVTYSTTSDNQTSVQYTDESGAEETYYLLKLPADIVNTGYAAGNFYQKLSFTSASASTGTAEDLSGTYYYNPHFAETVLSEEDVSGLDVNDLSDLASEVQVRTPRHLYMLGKYEAYFNSSHRYHFNQGEDLDYSIYSGYSLFNGGNSGVFAGQSPIGRNASEPFTGTYNGNGHTIENVTVETDENYVGLFGYSTGTIDSVAYLVPEGGLPAKSVTGHTANLYYGGLVGYNGGLIRNSAVSGVSMRLDAYSYSTVYAGGLVGQNAGQIRESAAASTGITVDTTLSNAYIGGFVGANSTSGTISSSYAVARISAIRAQTGTVNASGFAGSSRGSIRDSYAAADLQTGGGADTYGFCPTSTTNCYYLNDGNFEYDGESFTAQYRDSYASGRSYGEFTDGADGKTGTVAGLIGMSGSANSYDYGKASSSVDGDTYPYPGVVTDADGQTVHYGGWPIQMDLGDVGIYYWEKTVEYNDDGTERDHSYNFSVIKIDLNERELEKDDTLTTAHSDGLVVTEYGYGYYLANTNNIGVSASSTNLFYSKGSNNAAAFSSDSASENEKANAELQTLMSGSYTFHSYNTWGTERYQTDSQKQTGLYLNGDVTSGTMTLKVSTVGSSTLDFTFDLNPFFADTLTYASGPNGFSATTGEDGVPVSSAGLAGASEARPYGVRSVDQLQFINWNRTNKDTGTVLTSSNYTQFPYLSYQYTRTYTEEYEEEYYVWEWTGWRYEQVKKTRTATRTVTENKLKEKKYWKQSHDIDGQKKNYHTIAEFYDPTSANVGTLQAWFGGSYDGDDYVIQDVNIQGQTSSCTGLFGVVLNGTLKNMIMYSSDGTAEVTTGNDRNGQSRWMAAGVLAGLAATTDGTSAVTNCSTAGYTLVDQHYTPNGGWGGSCIGGLLGISNMELSNCTAVTTIRVTAYDNDNMRIGGLVGACQKTISSCYAGGSIEFGGSVPSGKGVYIGGIVGGIYFKQLNVVYGSSTTQLGSNSGLLTDELTNCYSYVELPAKGGSSSPIKGLYAIGGVGDLWQSGLANTGQCTMTNCYYLGAVVLSNNPSGLSGGNIQTTDANNTNVKSYTYAQMSNGTLLNALNNNGGGFAAVTAAKGSYSLKGKYSFATSSELLGTDYPFPTILTQQSTNDDRVNVHYGDWPVAGIGRERGGLPVSLDLFADYSDSAEAAVYTEKLTLSALVTDTSGTWSASVVNSDGSVSSAMTAEVTKDASDTTGRTATLTVTGRQAGYAAITVTYTVGSETYETTIDASVTARLQLLPSTNPVTIFAGETATIPLNLQDNHGNPLSDTLKNAVTMSSGDFTLEIESSYLSKAEASGTITASDFALTVTGIAEKTGMTRINLKHPYTYQGMRYSDDSALSLQVLSDTAARLADIDLYLEGKTSGSITCSANDLNLSVDDGDTAVTPTDLRIMEIGASSNENLLQATLSGDTVQISGMSAAITEDKASANFPIRLSFTYKGAVHDLWVTQTVNVHKGNADGTSTQSLTETLAEGLSETLRAVAEDDEVGPGYETALPEPETQEVGPGVTEAAETAAAAASSGAAASAADETEEIGPGVGW